MIWATVTISSWSNDTTEFASDLLVGGAGYDVIDNISGGNFMLDGFDVTGSGNGSGFEEIDLSGFVLEGTTGSDVFDFTGMLFRAVDTFTLQVLNAGDGDDTVTATDTNIIRVNGFSIGSAAYDLGAGNDVWTGAGLDDIVTGGSGSDTFVFSDGFDDDTITDFDALDDNEVIDLTAVHKYHRFC